MARAQHTETDRNNERILVVDDEENMRHMLSVMLHRLKAIQVRAYELSYDDFGRASGKLKDFGRVLERDGWETVVRAREDDEHVEMYLRTNGMRIAGLVVLALDMDEGEAVMVNIVGEIDPDEIGRLSRRFNFGVLD